MSLTIDTQRTSPPTLPSSGGSTPSKITLMNIFHATMTLVTKGELPTNIEDIRTYCLSVDKEQFHEALNRYSRETLKTRNRTNAFLACLTYIAGKDQNIYQFSKPSLEPFLQHGANVCQRDGDHFLIPTGKYYTIARFPFEAMEKHLQTVDAKTRSDIIAKWGHLFPQLCEQLDPDTPLHYMHAFLSGQREQLNCGKVRVHFDDHTSLIMAPPTALIREEIRHYTNPPKDQRFALSYSDLICAAHNALPDSHMHWEIAEKVAERCPHLFDVMGSPPDDIVERWARTSRKAWQNLLPVIAVNQPDELKAWCESNALEHLNTNRLNALYRSCPSISVAKALMSRTKDSVERERLRDAHPELALDYVISSEDLDYLLNHQKSIAESTNAKMLLQQLTPIFEKNGKGIPEIVDAAVSEHFMCEDRLEVKDEELELFGRALYWVSDRRIIRAAVNFDRPELNNALSRALGHIKNPEEQKAFLPKLIAIDTSLNAKTFDLMNTWVTFFSSYLESEYFDYDVAVRILEYGLFRDKWSATEFRTLYTLFSKKRKPLDELELPQIGKLCCIVDRVSEIDGAIDGINLMVPWICFLSQLDEEQINDTLHNTLVNLEKRLLTSFKKMPKGASRTNHEGLFSRLVNHHIFLFTEKAKKAVPLNSELLDIASKVLKDNVRHLAQSDVVAGFFSITALRLQRESDALITRDLYNALITLSADRVALVSELSFFYAVSFINAYKADSKNITHLLNARTIYLCGVDETNPANFFKHINSDFIIVLCAELLLQNVRIKLKSDISIHTVLSNCVELFGLLMHLLARVNQPHKVAALNMPETYKAWYLLANKQDIDKFQLITRPEIYVSDCTIPGVCKEAIEKIVVLTLKANLPQVRSEVAKLIAQIENAKAKLPEFIEEGRLQSLKKVLSN